MRHKLISKIILIMTTTIMLMNLYPSKINAQQVLNIAGGEILDVSEAITLTVNPPRPNQDTYQVKVDLAKLPDSIRGSFAFMGVPSHSGQRINLYDPIQFMGGPHMQPRIDMEIGVAPFLGPINGVVVIYDKNATALGYAEFGGYYRAIGQLELALLKDGGSLNSGITSSSNSSLNNGLPATPTPSAGPATVKSIAVSVSKIQLNLEETKAIKVQAILSDNTRKDVTDECDYFSNDTQVADVDSGNVTGIAKGETTIVVNYKGLEKTVPVEVNDPENLDLTKLEASEKSVKLKAGQQMELYITGVYEDNSREDVTGEVLWQSSKGSVATVVDGIISAKAIGAATITASLEGKTVQVKLIVEKAKKLKSLTASSNALTIKEEGTATIKVTATYVDNTKEDVTTKVIWNIVDPEVVDVKSGKFYALDLGTTKVTGKFDNKIVTLTVRVK